MARQYNPRLFFRQVSNTYLKTYFQQRNMLCEIDFVTMKETKIEPVYDAWAKLSDAQRCVMEKDFREIFFLSNKGATQAIIDEANWHNEDLATELSEQKNHYDRAFWTFLNRPKYWKGSIQFHYADNLPSSYWRKRKNLPKVSAVTPEFVIELFEWELGKYFYKVEGRGKNCKVECYRRNDLDYFYAYPEDYTQASIEWIDNEFERPPRTPAFEVIFVYSETEGTLNIFLPGNKKPLENLQRIFCKMILNKDLPPDDDDNKVYALDALQLRNFQFSIDQESEIEKISVRKLRLTSKHGPSERLTLEADPTHNSGAVYDLLEKLMTSVQATDYHVTQVGLKAFFCPEDDGKLIKTRSFDITYPNSCSLKQEGKDLLIRQLLVDSGLEPQEEQTSIDLDEVKSCC